MTYPRAHEASARAGSDRAEAEQRPSSEQRGCFCRALMPSQSASQSTRALHLVTLSHTQAHSRRRVHLPFVCVRASLIGSHDRVCVHFYAAIGATCVQARQPVCAAYSKSRREREREREGEREGEGMQRLVLCTYAARATDV